MLEFGQEQARRFLPPAGKPGRDTPHSSSEHGSRAISGRVILITSIRIFIMPAAGVSARKRKAASAASMKRSAASKLSLAIVSASSMTSCLALARLMILRVISFSDRELRGVFEPRGGCLSNPQRSSHWPRIEAFEKHGFELLLSLSFPIVSDEDAKVFADGSEASLGDLASMNSLSDSGNEMVTVVMGLTSKAHFIEGLKYSQYLRNYLKLSAPR